MVLGFSDNVWGQLLAFATGVAMLMRAHLFRYTTQVAPVLAAGLGALVLLGLGLALNPPHALMRDALTGDRADLDIRTIWLVAEAIAAAAALVTSLGLILPRGGLTPFWGRFLEVAEGFVLLTLIPLALAVFDVYGAAEVHDQLIAGPRNGEGGRLTGRPPSRLSLSASPTAPQGRPCAASAPDRTPHPRPAPKARHSASVYRRTVSGSRDEHTMATAPSGRYAISTRSSCSSRARRAVPFDVGDVQGVELVLLPLLARLDVGGHLRALSSSPPAASAASAMFKRPLPHVQ